MNCPSPATRFQAAAVLAATALALSFVPSAQAAASTPFRRMRGSSRRAALHCAGPTRPAMCWCPTERSRAARAGTSEAGSPAPRGNETSTFTTRTTRLVAGASLRLLGHDRPRYASVSSTPRSASSPATVARCSRRCSSRCCSRMPPVRCSRRADRRVSRDLLVAAHPAARGAREPLGRPGGDHIDVAFRFTPKGWRGLVDRRRLRRSVPSRLNVRPLRWPSAEKRVGSAWLALGRIPHRCGRRTAARSVPRRAEQRHIDAAILLRVLLHWLAPRAAHRRGQYSGRLVQVRVRVGRDQLVDPVQPAVLHHHLDVGRVVDVVDGLPRTKHRSASLPLRRSRVRPPGPSPSPAARSPSAAPRTA